MHHLYRLTNQVNQKVYIGQSSDLSKRWSDHKAAVKHNRPTQKIHYALIKYGVDRFDWDIIATCQTWDDANELETLLVAQYESHISTGKGYNSTRGGYNAPKTEEWKQKVSKKLTSNLDVFLGRAYKIHGNKYDYSKVIYIKARTNIKIICREHGEFQQTPDKHLNRNQGCPKCTHKVGGEKNKNHIGSLFIEKSKIIHGDTFDYSKAKYINASAKIEIGCKKHGYFWQTPNNHLAGYGCFKCGIELTVLKRGKRK